jgi:predicted dehydrogenase/threonine dehydrogenase-like Zn-dependent dehydrogenase
MQQLTQQLKSGFMEISEVPFPALGKGRILVRNHYSVISAGTEGKTVTDARKGYIAKARSRQKEVKQVIEMIKSQGLKETYNLVMNKLEAPASLGYSCAGEVIGVGEDVTGFAVGDFVACGGKDASHADVVSVSMNLCVRVPAGISLKHAAFATLASVAIQGIRQTELTVGSNCVIIGLGLIGQLTIQLLNAAGIKAIGIDLDERQVQAGLLCGAFRAYNRQQEGLEQVILRETNGAGAGADAVIITAGTSSLDPVELAGILCRRKGKVIIVGAVPTGFSRENYYRKELDLRMSCSYGPGRYDLNYEDKGIDYPVGYVRWTENRNMQTFIDLLYQGKLALDKIITHTFPLIDAPEAYTLILEKAEHFSGIVIEYDPEKEIKSTIVTGNKNYTLGEANVGFIGAGSFAQNMLLPRLKSRCTLVGVATAHGNTSRYVADKYKFAYCTDKASKIIEDSTIDTVFIATRHDLHAKYVMEALHAGKNVFVEKPLAITEKQLHDIRAAYDAVSSDKSPRIMVGYNRRFSPFIQKIKSIFTDNQPKTIQIRVNAGLIPTGHWVNDPEIGGGRIVGEACHFIDLAMYLAGSAIQSVYATGFSESAGLIDTAIINLTFKNGSVASVNYLANGNKSLPKEYIEVFCNGTVAMLDDFRKLTVLGKKKTVLKGNQDKGHKEELIQFIKAVKEGTPSPIPFEELYESSLVTFKVLESIREKRVISLYDYRQ